MKKGVTLTGDREFVNLLKKAIKKSPGLTRKVIRNGAEAGKNLAQDKAPYDTRFMKNNIRTQYPALHVALIISSASYSGYVNYGTRFMVGRPFFTDMWTETQRNMKKDFNDLLKGVLTD